MNPSGTYAITDDAHERADDHALIALLSGAYVGGGFTDPAVADVVFTPGAVRARGRLLYARCVRGSPIGTVIVVPPESPARRLAAADEAELHLLAVDERYRGLGLGHTLVRAALDAAQRAGHRGVVLWTQPTMVVAQRVYERAGFARAYAEDFARDGRSFKVYRRPL
jgi:GNAT superfamily N-acetyltransferase